MPELPDVTVYVEAIARRVVGERLLDVVIDHPFTLRSVEPKIGEVRDKRVTGVRRIGKRIAIETENRIFLVIHLMIAGRFAWTDAEAKKAPKRGLVAFRFTSGVLTLTEAGSKRRASLTLVRGETDLARIDRGGLEPIGATAEAFREALTRENRTLKRALTDPRLFSGIGNAYSDEILHAARLSPFKQTQSIGDDEVARLFEAVRTTLVGWSARLREETGDGFPEKVTAFREGMAVHGRYRQPCPVCGSPVQRVVYAANEANYCATCQTGGRLLADRSLSRLLREDWPRTLEELERRRRP